MESFSKLLAPSSSGRYPDQLRAQLLSPTPLIFEENLSASYVLRQSNQYTHNPTRAGICITSGYRLVVMASGQKKIDIPLNDARWLQGISITQDKTDRVVFKVEMGTYGTGTQGSSLEIKIRTKNAQRIKQITDQARLPVNAPTQVK